MEEEKKDEEEEEEVHVEVEEEAWRRRRRKKRRPICSLRIYSCIDLDYFTIFGVTFFLNQFRAVQDTVNSTHG